ncbi:MAG TPA: hypothetical protein VNX18_12650 [Bryobacteraceae bacterium]|jgi:hypothetical protein|nr:hypothetical protein [Bryobacteraceae bacterium]
MNDLRLPIGIFFAIVGILLVTMPGARAPLTESPVNLYAGLSMLLFGGAMLWLARRRS